MKNEVKKLNEMTGRRWMYRGRNLKITDHELVDGQVLISTDGQPIRIDKSKFSEALEEFLPIEHSKGKGLVLKGDAGRMQSLEQILMDSIHKVKEDPKYINQAKQISNSANTLVNITKTKLLMMREAEKRA